MLQKETTSEGRSGLYGASGACGFVSETEAGLFGFEGIVEMLLVLSGNGFGAAEAPPSALAHFFFSITLLLSITSILLSSPF